MGIALSLNAAQAGKGKTYREKVNLGTAVCNAERIAIDGTGWAIAIIPASDEAVMFWNAEGETPIAMTVLPLAEAADYAETYTVKVNPAIGCPEVVPVNVAAQVAKAAQLLGL